MPYAVKFYASFFSLFLAGCSAATPPPRDDLLERYKQFTARFIARLDEADITSECINKHRKMLSAAILTGDTETQRLASEGLNNCPPIKGFRSGETIDDYLDRITDEFQESDCTYQAAFDARIYGGYESRRRECLRDLELKRIRRELQKSNRQSR